MKKRFGVIATIVAAASFFSLITASVAWFEARTDVDFGTGHGSTAAAYFESGSGKSEAEAYVISSPIHMYNLAWLQYLGQFNTTVSPTYFKLKNDIDMSALGSALPPIGTQANPFIGIFDGQSHTISNLTVSNNINDIAKHPSTVQALSGVSVVGFFGIVGNPQPIGIQRGDTDLDYTELQVLDKLNLHHFNLQNIVVKSSTAQTLMGIVAGYVNGHDGTVHDIGVMNGSLQAAQGATCLDYFLNDDDPASPISKFSLIGETEDTEWREAYDDSGTGSSDGPGDDAGFGGSIDMRTFTRRITYMMGSQYSTMVSSGTSEYTSTSSSSSQYEFNFKSTTSRYAPFDWESSTIGGYVDLQDGTILPINIDNQDMGLMDADGNLDTTSQITTSKTFTGTYSSGWAAKSFKTNTQYNTKTSETISNNNTGYFVGSSTSMMRTKIQPISKNPSINLSLGFDYVSSSPTYSYDSSKFEMVAIDSSGSHRIQDDRNQNLGTSKFTYDRKTTDNMGFVNYSKVRDYIHDSLTSGTDYIYGVRFITVPSSSNVVSKTVSLYGTQKTGYNLYKGSVNFNLKSKGVVTMACGTFASSNVNTQNMGSIYQVDRSSGTAASPVEIKTIYQNSDGDIVYNPSSAPTGYTKVYDYSWYNGVLLGGAVYYAEIPLLAGDYLLAKASVGNSTYSGYMMYLDIGANGNGGGTDPAPGGGDYDLKNVRYVHAIVNDGTTNSSDDYIDILFKISTVGADGTIALYFSRHDATMLYYHQNGTATNVDVTVFIATTDNIQDATSAVWTS